MGYRDKTTLEEMVGQGMTQSEISDEFGVSNTTISRWMNKYDISTTTEEEEIHEALGRNETISDAAEELDISGPTMRYHMDKHDISFEPNQNEYTDQELKDLLIEHVQSGGNPSMRDVYNNDEMPFPSTYQDRFGSWTNAVKECGLEENHQDQPRDYKEPEVREHLKEAVSKMDTVSWDTLSEIEHLPSETWIRDHIGGMDDIYEMYNVPDEKKPTRSDQISPEEIIEQVNAIDEPVTTKKVESETDFSLSTIYNKVGSIQELCHSIGKEYKRRSPPGRGNKYSDEDLIRNMRDCYEKYGTVKVGLFKDDDDLPSYFTYIHRFGSWSNAKRAAGLEHDISSSGAPKEDIPEDRYTHKYTSKYLEMRSNVRERDNHTCQSCGKHEADLDHTPEAHHISWDFDDPDDAHFEQNLILLCKPCHGKVRAGEMECPEP